MAGLGGSDKTGMTEEGVSGPGDRIRGKTCGLTDAFDYCPRRRESFESDGGGEERRMSEDSRQSRGEIGCEKEWDVVEVE